MHSMPKDLWCAGQSFLDEIFVSGSFLSLRTAFRLGWQRYSQPTAVYGQPTLARNGQQPLTSQCAVEAQADRSLPVFCLFGGRLKRSARAVQLFGRLAVLDTHTLRY